MDSIYSELRGVVWDLYRDKGSWEKAAAAIGSGLNRGTLYGFAHGSGSPTARRAVESYLDHTGGTVPVGYRARCEDHELLRIIGGGSGSEGLRRLIALYRQQREDGNADG